MGISQISHLNPLQVFNKL